eukprot:g13970.t1
MPQLWELWKKRFQSFSHEPWVLALKEKTLRFGRRAALLAVEAGHSTAQTLASTPQRALQWIHSTVPTPPTQIQELFKRFDKDGNGRTELQNVLTWINKDITVAEIGKILREVDTNNDGAIDYNEFVAWTQGGKKSVTGKKKANQWVPDLQAALKRSEEEAAAVASIPFEAVMSVSYNGPLAR